MDTPRFAGKHAEITDRILAVFYQVHNELGFGFPEVLHSEAMRIALTQDGLRVGVEVPISVHFRGVVIGQYRADLIVQNAVLIELKSLEQLAKEHETQTLNYLRSTDLEVALLMNFGTSARFKRLVMDNRNKHYRSRQPQASSQSQNINPNP